MGSVMIKIKLMPESLETDLKQLRHDAEKIVKSAEGKGFRTEEEPIAFGLKALIVFFEIPESQELEPIEEKLGSMPGISSAQVVDMRRAL